MNFHCANFSLKKLKKLKQFPLNWTDEVLVWQRKGPTVRIIFVYKCTRNVACSRDVLNPAEGVKLVAKIF